MVSRVTTALLLALAASTDAAGRAPRALLGVGTPATSAGARALAAASEAALAAAAPRRALAVAASANGTAVAAIGASLSNATAPHAFVHVAADGTSFELDGRKFIAVGANQCACPRPASRAAARACGGRVRLVPACAESAPARHGFGVTGAAARLCRPVPLHVGPLGARAASAQARSRAARPLATSAVAELARGRGFYHDALITFSLLRRRADDDRDVGHGWRRNAAGPGGVSGSERCAQLASQAGAYGCGGFLCGSGCINRSECQQREADTPPDAVVRTWAFGELPANGNPKTPALQVAPGVYNEAMFAALDRVVFEAGKRGLRLLLALSNSWDAYGGAPAYPL